MSRSELIIETPSAPSSREEAAAYSRFKARKPGEQTWGKVATPAMCALTGKLCRAQANTLTSRMVSSSFDNTTEGNMSRLTFTRCLQEATGNLEFVDNFTRLTGIRLLPVPASTPLERLIDKTVGYGEVGENELAGFRQFALFVKDTIWDRLPAEVRDLKGWVIPGHFVHPQIQ